MYYHCITASTRVPTGGDSICGKLKLIMILKYIRNKFCGTFHGRKCCNTNLHVWDRYILSATPPGFSIYFYFNFYFYYNLRSRKFDNEKNNTEEREKDAAATGVIFLNRLFRRKEVM